MTLGLITKKMARCAPCAEISMLDTEYFDEESQVALAGVLSEVDQRDGVI